MVRLLLCSLRKNRPVWSVLVVAVGEIAEFVPRHCRDSGVFTQFFTSLVQRELFAEQKYAIMSVYPVRSR